MNKEFIKKVMPVCCPELFPQNTEVWYNSAMEKCFNIAGPCFPDEHDMSRLLRGSRASCAFKE